MFKKIKNFFNKRKIENYRIYTINYDNMKNDKTILTFQDFYIKTGVMLSIEKIVETSQYHKYHYKNLRANKNTCLKIRELLKHNLLNTKNKYKRMYKEKYLLNMLAVDDLYWGPYVDDSINDDKIIVLLPTHKDFVIVTEEML